MFLAPINVAIIVILMYFLLIQDSSKSRQQKRLEQEQEKTHMESEMAEALQMIQSREAAKEAERRQSSTARVRIATPGAKTPSSSRHTPKRFGL